MWIIRTSYLKIYCNSSQKCIAINEYANYPSATLIKSNNYHEIPKLWHIDMSILPRKSVALGSIHSDCQHFSVLSFSLIYNLTFSRFHTAFFLCGEGQYPINFRPHFLQHATTFDFLGPLRLPEATLEGPNKKKTISGRVHCCILRGVMCFSRSIISP